MSDKVKTETQADYTLISGWTEDQIIAEAKKIIKRRFDEKDEALTSPKSGRMKVQEYLRIHQHGNQFESFGAIFMDNRHRPLSIEELFQGSIDTAHVHPRVIVKRALDLGAAAVIIWHNHPSGEPNPSQADLAITRKIRDALELMDIRLLDHFIAADNGVFSMAERGII